MHLGGTTPPGRRLAGTGVTVLGVAVAVGGLMPFRTSISVETAALVLVVPVVLGVALGGVTIAPLGVIAGFVAFDVFFIPPYGTLRVAAGYHWISLVVYALVSLVIGGVVAQLYKARDLAERREAELRIFYELAEVVAGSRTVDAAHGAITALAALLFGASTSAILLTEDGGSVRTVAQAGERLTSADLDLVSSRTPLPRMSPLGSSRLIAGLLATTSGAATTLVLRPAPTDPEQLRLLDLFAMQAGVVIDRARLSEEAARMTALAEVDRLRSALMRSVSHDLRTPLASIKASISDLADGTIDLDLDASQTLLATIEEETDRLTRFVTNLLDMTRIESGALQLNRGAVPLDELIESVLVRFGRLLGDSVSLQIPDDLPLVDADYTLVDQVVANLVENAIQHCPSNTPIVISASPGTGWVEARVADEGPGIARADQDHIFEMFYRGTAPSTRGTGIGLAICAGVIAAHGGQLWLESVEGGGSTFVFRLPTARDAPFDEDDTDVVRRAVAPPVTT